MACLAPRESHAARACRQGRKRSRAWKLKSPDGSVSRCSRAQRMGRRTRKSVAALAGRPPACDPARPRSAGADIRIGGRRRAAWNRAWAPRPSGHGMRPVGGCWAPAGIGDDVAAGTEAGSRVAAPRHESGRTAFPRRSRPICARDRRRRDGSPHGTATVLRNVRWEKEAKRCWATKRRWSASSCSTRWRMPEGWRGTWTSC